MISDLDVFCAQTFVQLSREEELTLVKNVCSNEELETKDNGDSVDNLTISKKTELKVKKKTFPSSQSFPCDNCEKVWKWRWELKRHMRIHTRPPTKRETGRNYDCTDQSCNKRFRLKNDLKQHMRLHTGDNLLTCGICQKKFTSKYAILHHVAVHTGEKPFRCDLCGNQFTQPANLRTHIKNKHSNSRLNLTRNKISGVHQCQTPQKDEIQCTDCCVKEKTEDEELLKDNISETLTVNQPLSVTQSDFDSDSKKDLKLERWSHCPQCFKKVGNLKRHMRENCRGTKEKLTDCQFCGAKIFKSRLAEHQDGRKDRVSGEVKVVGCKEKQSRGEGIGKEKTVCRVCGKLLEKDYVRRHMKRFHEADRNAVPQDDVQSQFSSLDNPYQQETHNEYVEKERPLFSSENVKIEPELTSVIRREVSVIKLNPNIKQRRATESIDDFEGKKRFHELEMH